MGELRARSWALRRPWAYRRRRGGHQALRVGQRRRPVQRPKTGTWSSEVYQIFYFSINFGSFFSTLLTPVLYEHVGPEVAFGVPGVLMGLATFVFWLGRKPICARAAEARRNAWAARRGRASLLLSPLFALIVGLLRARGHWTPPRRRGVVGRGCLLPPRTTGYPSAPGLRGRHLAFHGAPAAAARHHQLLFRCCFSRCAIDATASLDSPFSTRGASSVWKRATVHPLCSASRSSSRW